MEYLQEHQVENLPVHSIQGFTSEHLENLSSDALGGFHEYHLEQLSPDAMSGASLNLGAFQPEAMAGLNEQHIGNIEVSD